MQVKLNVIVAAAVALCAGAVQAQDITVRIGHVGPVSGSQAHYGKDNENGARMAVADLNKQNVMIGGKHAKFELVAEDDAADPKQGTAAATKLCDQKVNGVVGHLNSGTTIPASKIYNACGMPEITPSATNPALTQAGLQQRLPPAGQRQRAGLGPGAVRRRRPQAQAHRRHRRPHGLRPGRRRSVQEGRGRARHRDRQRAVHERQGHRLHVDPDGHQVEEPGRHLLRRHGPASRPDAAPDRDAGHGQRQVLRRRRHLHREADRAGRRRQDPRQRGVRARRRLHRQDAWRHRMEEALRRRSSRATSRSTRRTRTTPRWCSSTR